MEHAIGNKREFFCHSRRLSMQAKSINPLSIDIAHELSFSRPSVSVAMKNLKE